MANPVIKVQNVSKQYRLGQVGTGSFNHDLNRWWHKVRGKNDPYLKIGETNDRETKAAGEYVWALKDISFEVLACEVLGIIGRNGAGKSTLLKILSRTTTPTTGKVLMKGRVASLLEVGTGFHADLTGRENIYLNGAILGMRRYEIDRKLDEIIDFAGVERYIDTPVKRYSSGMYVRLAFAVAAHLEPEILIVDEVLAVGDAEFQKKCLGKMKDVSVNEGRTVIFVSHNMAAIQNLCTSCLFMEQGKLIKKDTTEKVIRNYLSKPLMATYKAKIKGPDYPEIYCDEIEINNTAILNLEPIDIKIKIESTIEERVTIDFRMYNANSIPVGFGSIGTFDFSQLILIKKGTNNLGVKMHVRDLAIGEYLLGIDITKPNIKYYERLDNCLGFEIVKTISSHQSFNQSWNYGSLKIQTELYEHN